MTESVMGVGGLLGEFGWDEPDEVSHDMVSTALLIAATSTCWALMWLSTGLQPFPSLTSRLGLWGAKLK